MKVLALILVHVNNRTYGSHKYITLDNSIICICMRSPVEVRYNGDNISYGSFGFEALET